MNKLIKINDISLSIKEYNRQRVVTFKDVDTVHGRPDGTASRNFRSNRKHFIEGEDFFILELTTDEIRRQFGAGKNAGKTMTLLTESGYLMLVKSFTDDSAWNVQRQLVKMYFKAQEEHTKMTPMEMIAGIANGCVELEKRMTQLENKLDEDRTTTIKETLSYGRINHTLRKEISAAVKMKSLEICRFASTFDKMGKRVMSNIYKSLQKHFNVESYNDLTFNQYTDAIIFIKLYEPDTKLSVAITKAMPKVDMSLLSSIMETKQNVKERET